MARTLLLDEDANLGLWTGARIVGVFLSLFVGFTSISHASGVEYRYTKTPAGFVPYAINDIGVLAGSRGDDAAILEDGAIRVIGTWMWGLGINNRGNVALWSPSGRSYVYADGVIQEILMPNAARHITAQDIDDEGQIVGHFQEWDYPWRQHAFKWRSGAAEQFDHPDFDGIARHRISVTGCNNAGDLVGAYVGENDLQGFLYRNGIFSATSTNRPMDINDRGQIVGIPGDVSAVFDPSGEINTIAFPGALITSAHSIDNFGRVVGYYQLGNGDNKRYGFVATPMLPVRVSVVRRNLPAAAGGALFVTLTRSDTGDPSPLLRVEIDRINGSDVEPVVGEGPVRGFGISGLDSARVTYRFDARALTPHLLPGRNILRVVVSLGSGLFLAGEAELSGPTPK